MHTYPLSEYMRFVDADDWNGVAGLMLSSAEKLARAGANFLICPDNTIHRAFELMVARSPRPWLHIVEEVAKEARRQGHHRLAVLGTRYTMEGPVYPKKLAEYGIDHRVPDPEQRARINEIIFNELVYADFRAESLDYFVSVIADLKNEGCDAVVLGCTEIPLLVTAESSPLPILDSTRLLARAAVKRAVGENVAAAD